jgi:hypothetical protein
MTTKTIPAYLEDERRKLGEDQLRIEEAGRIETLNHRHHRTSKQPSGSLPSPVQDATPAKETAIPARVKRRTPPKTPKKTRKAA